MRALLLIVLLAFQVNLYSQPAINSTSIDSLVSYAMNTMVHAGVAVGVVHEGEIIHLKGYGLASANEQKAVDENTLFAIASNSKAFTTTALAILVDRGELNWTDKVVDHIPEFKMYDPYITANFTIVDLLTHRSGMGLGAGDLMFFPDGADFTIDDILKSFQYQKQVSDFRTKYDYDNLLYVVAGEVVHRVSGKPWDQFVEEEIMNVLDMQQSVGIYQNITNNSNVAMPHKAGDGELKQFGTYTKSDGSLGAAGGIYSNVADLCKWMTMHLNRGKYGEDLQKELISEASHNELWKIHTNISFSAIGRGPYNSHYRGYGLGFSLTDQNGFTIISHTGGLPGMLSMITMIPELNVGIVVLTNCDPGGYSFLTLSNEIKDAFIEAEDSDWVMMAKERLEQTGSEADSVVNEVWKQVEISKAVKVNYDDFIGTYKDNWFGKVEVYLKDKTLWFRSERSPKLHGQMHLYKANTFAVDWDYDDMDCDAFAMFQLDENGKAQSIKMKGISPNIDFSFDFHDLDLRRVQE